jgi:hypothetical protein
LGGALLAIGLYAVTLGGTYIYDDVAIVNDDPRVKDPHHWGQFWTQGYWTDGIDQLYRPLVSQTYGIQWWLDGGKPWMFHAFNVLMHALAAALVAELGRRLSGWRVGLIAGLLFAAHPVHAEAVAGIVGRAELMCAVGMLGAMILFLGRPMTLGRAIGIAALSAMAMLSKEQGMLMPALLAALWPVRRSQKSSDVLDARPEKNAMSLLIILLTWSVSLLIVLREFKLKLLFEWDRSFLDFTIQPLIHSHGADRWLIPVSLVGRYAGLLVAPLHLSIDYSMAVLGPTLSLADPYLWLGASVIVAWIAATAIAAKRRAWTIPFCLLAAGITYSMASNLVIIGTIFGERLIYLPSIFILILFAIGLEKLPRPARISILILAVVLGSVRTFTYVRHWNDRDSFYSYSLANQPRSVHLHLLVAHRAFEEDRLHAARAVMAEARGITPDYWQVWMYSGRIEEKAENWQAAYEYLDRARRLLPSFPLEQRAVHAAQMLDAQRQDARRKAATEKSNP